LPAKDDLPPRFLNQLNRLTLLHSQILCGQQTVKENDTAFQHAQGEIYYAVRYFRAAKEYLLEIDRVIQEAAYLLAPRLQRKKKKRLSPERILREMDALLLSQPTAIKLFLAGVEKFLDEKKKESSEPSAEI
jgi:hypothetical protein